MNGESGAARTTGPDIPVARGAGRWAARRAASTTWRRLALPLLAAVVALLLAVPTVLLAPAAMATPTTDDQFLADWQADGLYASSDEAAIDVAHAIVAFLDAQPTFAGIDRLADDIVHATKGSPGLVHYTYYEAGEQIYLAVHYYGPQHLALLNAYTDPNRRSTPAPTTPAPTAPAPTNMTLA